MADAVTGTWIQRPLLWGAAGLCLVVAWFFADATLGGGAFFVQDVMVQNVPFRFYLHEALGRGELPLWVPQISAGFPLLLHPASQRVKICFYYPRVSVCLVKIIRADNRRIAPGCVARS